MSLPLFKWGMYILRKSLSLRDWRNSYAKSLLFHYPLMLAVPDLNRKVGRLEKEALEIIGWDQLYYQ